VKLKMIELFAGIGGFRLASDWVGGIETIVSVEINPFCQKVLKKNFPNTPIYDDVTTYKPTSYCDLVVGGSPCQDLSIAGVQKGIIKGKRSSLWFEQLRIYKESRATKAGMMRNGKLSAQPPLERHTLESEYFSLPTPQAYSFQKSHRPGQTKLDVKLRLLLPTPSVCGNHNRKGASKTSGDGLVTALQKLLPTPTAHLAKETGAPSEALRNHPTLDHILGLATGQVLSPQFVEWMQGFPIGWTDFQH